MTLKKGDLVRCVDNRAYENYMNVGDLGYVTKAYHSAKTIAVTTLRGDVLGCYPSRWEKVGETED